MSLSGGDKANEFTFQNDMIKLLTANGWLLGKAENYNRKLAIYEEDLLGFVKDTQKKQWEKYCRLYPKNPDTRARYKENRLRVVPELVYSIVPGQQKNILKRAVKKPK